MVFRKRRDIGNYRGKHYLVIFGELDLEKTITVVRRMAERIH
jgi:hypothetical protein